jgi:hypothetical protein
LSFEFFFDGDFLRNRPSLQRKKIMKTNLRATSACLGTVLALGCIMANATGANAEWKFQNSNVRHEGQPESWACSPTTISMWISSIHRTRGNLYSYTVVPERNPRTVNLSRGNVPPLDIANQCCRGGKNGDATDIAEFIKGMYDWTPSNPPYVYAEWAYSNEKTAVKGIMWTIARYGEPVAIAGGNGMHYLLIRGGRADYNPFTYYSENNHIRGVYVNDATENSPVPNYKEGPVSRMYKDKEYNPAELMKYWTPIGNPGILGIGRDKKYRSIERYGTTAKENGKRYDNNDFFKDF